MDNAERVRRGERAKQIIADPLFQEAWEVYRAKVFAAIENAKSDEGTLRGKLMLTMLNDVRSHFEVAIKEGDYATYEIKLEEERKKRWYQP